jgi:PAS domain S-box-containing protein
VFLDDPEIFRNVVDNLQTGIYLTDCQRRIMFWNKGAEHITGYMRHEVVGRFCRDNILMHCNEAGTILCEGECPLAESIRDGKQKEGQFYLRHKTGYQVPVKVWTIAIRDARGAIVGAAESFEVRNTASEQERHQSTLAAHGCLDTTTGLPNHGLTRSHLRESLVLFAEHHLPFGVLCIQLELVEFEAAHSWEAMHAILQVSARTIAHILGPTAFLGRWAENQFLAILPECGRVELEKLRHETYRVVNSSEFAGGEIRYPSGHRSGGPWSNPTTPSNRSRSGRCRLWVWAPQVREITPPSRPPLTAVRRAEPKCSSLSVS